TLKPLNAQLASWSNNSAPIDGNNAGTGVLNAILAEMQRAIDDNIALKNKYDAEIGSIVSQVNAMAGKLSGPVSQLSTDSGKLDSQLKEVNAYLNLYYNALNSVAVLAEKVDQVLAMLDQFKPDVDIVYGIVQPLSWFIEL